MSDVRAAELAQGLAGVRARIAAACASCGRDAGGITLVAVTKHHPASDVELLAGLGVQHVGENRHQEAAAKLAELDPRVRSGLSVHFVGQLQTNKAAPVAGYADLVHTVDRARLARALDRGAQEQRSEPLPVLVQVDLQEGREAGRGGAVPGEVEELAAVVAGLPGLRLRGLMAVAPLGAPAAPAFERLAALAARVRRTHPGADVLSAGMSGDLEEAVAAGATHLRVGTAILGSRPAHR